MIIGDANLSEVSTYLKVGTTALVLAMIEDTFLRGCDDRGPQEQRLRDRRVLDLVGARLGAEPDEIAACQFGGGTEPFGDPGQFQSAGRGDDKHSFTVPCRSPPHECRTVRSCSSEICRLAPTSVHLDVIAPSPDPFPVPARWPGRPPRAAPPEHCHRRGDRAAGRRRRPGRAPNRCVLPAATPGPACPRRRLRAAVLIRTLNLTRRTTCRAPAWISNRGCCSPRPQHDLVRGGIGRDSHGWR